MRIFLAFLFFISCSQSEQSGKVHHRIFSDSLMTTSGPILPSQVLSIYKNPKQKVHIEDGMWIFFEDKSFKDTVQYFHVKDSAFVKSDMYVEESLVIKGKFNKNYRFRNDEGLIIRTLEYWRDSPLGENHVYEELFSQDGNVIKTINHYSNGRDEVFFRKNERNGRNEEEIELSFDSLGNFIEAYKLMTDTKYVDDNETGELIQVITQWNEPLSEYQTDLP